MHQRPVNESGLTLYPDSDGLVIRSEANISPSPENAREVIVLVCPGRGPMRSPQYVHHILNCQIIRARGNLVAGGGEFDREYRTSVVLSWVLDHLSCHSVPYQNCIIRKTAKQFMCRWRESDAVTPAERSFRGPKATFPLCTSRTECMVFGTWGDVFSIRWEYGAPNPISMFSQCQACVKVTGFGGRPRLGFQQWRGY